MKSWVIPAQLRDSYQRLSYSEAYNQSVFLNNNEHIFTSLIKELLLHSELVFFFFLYKFHFKRKQKISQ